MNNLTKKVDVIIGGRREIIPIYLLDNIQSIKNRIALTFETIPENLYFDEELILSDIKDKDEIYAEDLKQIIKEVSVKLDNRKVRNYEELFKRLSDRLSEEEIIGKIIDYDKIRILKLPEQYRRDLFVGLLNNRELSSELETKLENIESENYDELVMRELAETVKRDDSDLSDFFSFTTDFDTTTFKTKSVDVKLIFDTNTTLPEIFNNIKLNNTIPMANMEVSKGNTSGSNIYYKILKEIDSNIIDMYLKEMNDEAKKIYEDYTRREIEYIYENQNDYPLSFTKKETIKILLDYTKYVKIGKKREELYNTSELRIEDGKVVVDIFIKDVSNISLENYIYELVNLLQLDNPSIAYENIEGSYNIMDKTFNTYVMSDLIFNDPLFSKYMYIQDKVASKEKSSYYVYFNFPGMEPITAFLTPSEVDKNNKLRSKYDLGTPYIRVNIKNVKNTEQLEQFKNLFEKYIKNYTEKEEQILSEYKDIIAESFGNVSTASVKDEKNRKKEIKNNLAEVKKELKEIKASNKEILKSINKVLKQTEKLEKQIKTKGKYPNIDYIIKNYKKIIPEDDIQEIYSRGRNEAIENIKKYLNNMKTNITKRYKELVKKQKEYQNELEMIKNKNVAQSLKLLEKKEFIKTPFKGRGLKGEVPELFISGYSRACSEERQPNVIETEEIDDVEMDGYQVMKFPKEGDLDIPIESKNYVCNSNDVFKYPGLQVNKLKNKDKIPFIPCCFSLNQLETEENTNRRIYEEEIEIEKEDKKAFYLYKTMKTMDPNSFAELPKSINVLFQSENDIPESEYLRLGVDRSPSSFLSCVLFALNINYDSIENERLKLTNINVLSAGKQELYEYDKFETTNIVNSNEYLDPNLFINVLQKYYKCNIILFSSEKKGFAEMVLPTHVENYYITKNKYPYIFIYEHLGNVIERNKYPQCELIVRWDQNKVRDKENVVRSYSSEENITKGMSNVLFQMKKSYSLTKLNIDVPVYYPDSGYSFINQFVDTNGKSRGLNIKFQGQIVTMITDPMQPIDVNCYDDFEYYKDIPLQTAVELAALFQMPILGKFNNNLGDCGIKCKWSIYNVYIYTFYDSEFDEATLIPDIENDNLTLNQYDSKLDLYKNNKKTALCLQEYMFWLYSEYINENNIDISTKDESIINKSIENFIDSKIEIDPRFTYNYVSKKFIIPNPSLMKGNKLVFINDEMLKRMVFILQLKIIRYNEQLKKYYTYISIPNYYSNISDFEEIQGQVLLEGRASVLKFKNSLMKNKYLSNEIIPNIIEPYFILNYNISNKISLSQNAKDIDYAINLSKIWNKEGYNAFPRNIGDTESKEDDTIILYSYKNAEKIEPYVINESSTRDNYLKIVGYKYGNVDKFTSIFDLNKI